MCPVCPAGTAPRAMIGSPHVARVRHEKHLLKITIIKINKNRKHLLKIVIKKKKTANAPNHRAFIVGHRGHATHGGLLSSSRQYCERTRHCRYLLNDIFRTIPHIIIIIVVVRLPPPGSARFIIRIKRSPNPFGEMPTANAFNRAQYDAPCCAPTLVERQGGRVAPVIVK